MCVDLPNALIINHRERGLAVEYVQQTRSEITKTIMNSIAMGPAKIFVNIIYP